MFTVYNNLESFSYGLKNMAVKSYLLYSNNFLLSKQK